MINFQDEIRRFKPSLDIEHIEDAIAKSDLTDMNDLMIEFMKSGVEGEAATAPAEVLRAIDENR